MQSWAKIGYSSLYVQIAFGVAGVVYVILGIVEIHWRDALDSFVTAAAAWLVAGFLHRFRRAVECMMEDADWEAGMVKVTKELHDMFEIAKTLSILYLLRYLLLFILFLVRGVLGLILPCLVINMLLVQVGLLGYLDKIEEAMPK
jgi:hypothetical protein